MQTTPGPLAELGGSELESFVLARLERLATRLADPRVREVPAWERLARHAMAAAISDCLELGLASETLPILQGAFGYPARV